YSVRLLFHHLSSVHSSNYHDHSRSFSLDFSKDTFFFRGCLIQHNFFLNACVFVRNVGYSIFLCFLFLRRVPIITRNWHVNSPVTVFVKCSYVKTYLEQTIAHCLYPAVFDEASILASQQYISHTN